MTCSRMAGGALAARSGRRGIVRGTVLFAFDDEVRLTYKRITSGVREAGENPARPRHCQCRGFERCATGAGLGKVARLR
jgi:hypothetical protein